MSKFAHLNPTREQLVPEVTVYVLPCQHVDEATGECCTTQVPANHYAQVLATALGVAPEALLAARKSFTYTKGSATGAKQVPVSMYELLVGSYACSCHALSLYKVNAAALGASPDPKRMGEFEHTLRTKYGSDLLREFAATVAQARPGRVPTPKAPEPAAPSGAVLPGRRRVAR
jgi:hypothetical protein